MVYKYYYQTPKQFSNIILVSDGNYLTGLYFEKDDEKVDFLNGPIEGFKETINWLDIYFSGRKPDFMVKYKLENLTDFRRRVYDVLVNVNYGETLTYKEIANILAEKRNIKKMSAQAVGNALKNNPIGIIVPCHRIIGQNGKLVGYAGGLNNKIELLKLEKIIY